MNCNEAQDLFAEYWDLTPGHSRREAVDSHLQHCSDCLSQFKLWEESEELIRRLSMNDELIGPIDHVNREVMDRIYAEDSWLLPVNHKSYQFSRHFRRNLAIVIASCLAMFACGLFFFLFGADQSATEEQMATLTGLMDTANASGDGAFIQAEFSTEVPVASISDPFVLQVVPTYPGYWVALSLLGVIMTLLILNWLSRTRN
ncbi:anti-sigma factor family protein [Paenibacillus sp. GCM10023252]|uniref:anti-sigma factor family protein n=1 Tax=Paenibacillus sp. GCM10023252 TaxID=3252649 RepID=UPI00360FE3F1